MILKKNNAIQLKIRVTDSELVSISNLDDLTEVVFVVKESPTSSTPILLKKLSDEDTQISVNTGTGYITVQLTQSDLNITPGSYVWGIQLIYDNLRYELTTYEGTFKNHEFIVENEITSYTE